MHTYDFKKNNLFKCLPSIEKQREIFFKFKEGITRFDQVDEFFLSFFFFYLKIKLLDK